MPIAISLYPEKSPYIWKEYKIAHINKAEELYEPTSPYIELTMPQAVSAITIFLNNPHIISLEPSTAWR